MLKQFCNMSGINPYINKPISNRPTKPFYIDFCTYGKDPIRHKIDPDYLPEGHTGLKGSILDIAMGLNIDIDHACGGVCACSTCHILITKGIESCSEATEEEEDQLDKAPGLTSKSRLACQTIPNGTCDLIIEIPNWNRNLVQEGK